MRLRRDEKQKKEGEGGKMREVGRPLRLPPDSGLELDQVLVPRPLFLGEDEQVITELFGVRTSRRGPGVVLIYPPMKYARLKGLVLSPTEYAHSRDLLTGEMKTIHGPCVHFREPYEEIMACYEAVPLRANEYVKIIDTRTGAVRVVKGECRVTLSPTEKALTPVSRGVEIDGHTAVLVRDLEDGTLRLVTEHGIFIPGPYEEIVEERRIIVLEKHECVVIVREDGSHEIKRGSCSFFLPPYCGLLTFHWSTGVHKDSRDLEITALDLRPKYMWYEFDARTKDNVEITLGITFFWQIVDVEKMILSTDDAPGDICSHARSAIIQAVSQTSLERFLENFNSIVRKAVLDEDDAFYGERGVRIHSVEVRSISCKDKATQKTLQEIINETTERLKRLQKQESSNEIRMKALEGEIEAEKRKEELVAVRMEIARKEARTQALAEAERVRAFMEECGDELSVEQKVELFRLLRKKEILSALAAGNAALYFTPSDVELSIETRSRLPGDTGGSAGTGADRESGGSSTRRARPRQ